MENGLIGGQAFGDFLSRIDWSRPWLAPLWAAGAALSHGVGDWRKSANLLLQQERLSNHRGQPLCLVDQAELPTHLAYETYIGATGRIPTRDNAHDFFNALMWLAWPIVKARLNALQAQAIALQETDPGAAAVPVRQRGGLRDALTLFDENAAVVVASDPTLCALLQRHAWQTLFMERRAEFGRQWEVLLFGHALLEKLVTPYKAITAHAWLIQVDADFFMLQAAEKITRLDHLIAQRLQIDLRPAAFTPLPVLGVPGWADGQTVAYYDDVAVFRPPRATRL